MLVSYFWTEHGENLLLRGSLPPCVLAMGPMLQYHESLYKGLRS